VRRALLATIVCLAVAAPASAQGTWLAGDLHVHTCYSHDVWCGPDDDNTGPEDFYTFGHTVADDFQLAGLRGLDYLAITDHNDIRSQSDPGFGADGVVPVPGYENSLHGHGQMLGARRIYDNGDSSNAAVAAMAAQLRADGGVFQANHPSDPLWEYGYDVPVDTVEVWNLPRFYQAPAPSSSDNDWAVRYWQGWLDRGAHVTATGGSDSHWRITDTLQGVGNPTTWVYARSRDAAGVLDGLRRGRTFITWVPPAFAPPRLLLGDDRGHLPGDTVRPGSTLSVRVEGAPGARLRIVGDGGKVISGPVTVTGASFTHRFTPPRGTTWAYAELYGEDAREQRAATCDSTLGDQTTYCRNRIALLAMTSAIYIRAGGTE
jgi:hypothetical protein